MPAAHGSSRPDTSPPLSRNAVIERTQSQWLFTADELRLTPSVVQGLPVAQEWANRQKGVNFITQVGIMLKLPQLTLATAAVYLHRFFMRHAMVQANQPGVHHYSVAATAIFLATKVEENYRKMTELVVACCRVAQKQPNLVVDEQSKEYWKWRDTILHNEDLLLEALCFDLQLEQPYRILLDYLRGYGVQENKPLRNASWAFLNDSLVTTMCLQLTPSAIAGCALYMGVKLVGLALPDDDDGRPWWEQLALDIRDIQRGCNLMADVYENPSLPRQGQKDAYTRDDDTAIFDRTRQPATPLYDRSPAGSAASGSQGRKRERDVADGRTTGDWDANAPEPPATESHSGPSPKKAKRESRGGSAVPDPGVAPGIAAVRSTTVHEDCDPAADRAREVDDVQRRIDEIVHNASNSRRPRPTSSERPSQAAHESATSSRPQSSSGSNAYGPPLVSRPSYQGGRNDRADRRDHPLTTERPSADRHDPDTRSNTHGRIPRRSPTALNDPSDGRRRTPNGVSDGDRPDDHNDGSEEGEL